MPSPLTGILSPKVRRDVYTVYAGIGLLIVCVQAAIGAVSAGPTPDFLKAALAVYAFIGTAIGATAASNVTVPDDEDGQDGQDGQDGRDGDAAPARRPRRARRTGARSEPRHDPPTPGA